MKHVLVIRLSALGDVAILAPVMRRVAAANPDVHYTVAAPPLLEPLFESIDGVSFVGVKKKQRTWTMFLQLKAIGADSVADLHVVNRVGRALLLLRLDALLHGHCLQVTRLRKGRLSRWLVLRHLSRHPRRPQWKRYADVFGVKIDTIDTIGIKGNSAPVTIGFAPFAQHEGKIWPREYSEQLVQLLTSKGYRVLLFGSKEEAPLLEQWASQCTGAESLAGKHDFREELEIIKGLTLMVSMDSANLHFASAVGTPAVSIWGATHPDFGFYGFGQPRFNALCANLPCQPCSAFGQRPCRYGDMRCMQTIKPEQVVEKIEALLHAAQA